MEHDYLCYWHGSTELNNIVACDDCDLIAKVRKDERSNNFTPDDFSDSVTAVLQAAVERVMALPWTSPSWQAHTERVAILSAIRGDPE